jgi:hypothetical protein
VDTRGSRDAARRVAVAGRKRRDTTVSRTVARIVPPGRRVATAMATPHTTADARRR